MRTDFIRPSTDAVLGDQPMPVIFEAAGLYFRSILLAHAGHVVPQHVHDHPHATLVASGAARGWSGNACLGDRVAGEAFEIEAGSDHTFMALEDGTRLVCVHDVASAESVKAKEAACRSAG